MEAHAARTQGPAGVCGWMDSRGDAAGELAMEWWNGVEWIGIGVGIGGMMGGRIAEEKRATG